MFQIRRQSTPCSGVNDPIRAHVWLHVDVPPPSPDVVPMPIPPYPVPPDLAPEITDPVLPGQIEPVREPGVPAPGPMNGYLH